MSNEERRDIVAYGRFNVRHLAGIAHYLEMCGYRIRSKSDLLSMSVETLHNIIKEKANPPIREISSDSEAVRILQAYGLHFQPGSRQDRNITHNLQIESLEDEVVPATLSDMEEEARRLQQMLDDEEGEE